MTNVRRSAQGRAPLGGTQGSSGEDIKGTGEENKRPGDEPKKGRKEQRWINRFPICFRAVGLGERAVFLFQRNQVA